MIIYSSRGTGKELTKFVKGQGETVSSEGGVLESTNNACYDREWDHEIMVQNQFLRAARHKWVGKGLQWTILRISFAYIF